MTLPTAGADSQYAVPAAIDPYLSSAPELQ